MNLKRYKSIFAELPANGRDLVLVTSLALFSLIIKAIPAAILGLGNDEAYYWTYAMFPAWSHFDHPPMVGFLIQLFTLNLKYSSEIFIRAGSLALSTADIFLLFYLVRRLYSRRAACFALLMYISSVYFNIISGLFILPDSPQVFFVLLALNALLPAVTTEDPGRKESIRIILFGVFTGLAFLSKYHSLFLWLGAWLYILFHNRIWLKKPALYLGMVLTIIVSLPVIIWNGRNDFISFTFHGSRADLVNSHLDLTSFLQFNLGEFFYQNPVLSVIYMVALAGTLSVKSRKLSPTGKLLLYMGIPMILVFTFLSLFRTVLPHWSGPAFICLIIFSAGYLDEVYDTGRKIINRSLASAGTLFIAVIVLGTVQVRTGFIGSVKNSQSAFPGEDDFTLDMFGWDQARARIVGFLKRPAADTYDPGEITLVAEDWYQAAHIDYYIASPLGIRLIAPGEIERIHKYYWINKLRGINRDGRIIYVTNSRNYHSPDKFAGSFTGIAPADTLKITRMGKTVELFYLYEMTGLRPDSGLFSSIPERK